MPDNDVTSNMTSQLVAATQVILANGWATEAKIASARAQLAISPAPLPTAGRSRLSQFLVDQKVVSREQAQDLDSLMRNQAHMSGFQLLKKIGSGGMGVVFLAKHLASGKICALKTLNTRLADEGDFVSRFHREAQALTGITHPNIACVLESGESEGHCYLAMEYIEGPSVMTMLRDYKALPELYALRLVKQVSEGLAHVYTSSGLIHRDIKPENILVVRSRAGADLFPEEDVAKLIDFGLVKSMDEKDERLTQTGMTIGTPLYMSPEQVRGEPLDCRSDIYGLGATLYHLLTGSTPFTGTSPGAIMSAHLTEPIPDPSLKVPSLSADTKRIVATAMAKDINSRFLTHEALINACNTVIQSLSGKADGAPRLLRKPMVLKNTVAIKKTELANKKSEEAQPTPETSASPSVSNGAHHDRVSSRIIAKHRRLQGEAAPDVDAKHETSVTRSVPRTVQTRSITAMPTSAGTADRGTSGQPLVRNDSLPTAVPAAPVAQAQADQLRSAAIDAQGRHGMGIVPWIVLGVALLALAGYMVFIK